MTERLRAYCAREPRHVLYDEEAGVLMDLASGKMLTVAATDLEAVEERANADTSLLGVRLKDGRAFALSEVGIAFAPVFTNTGTLEELPAAVCWADFRSYCSQLKLELYATSTGPGVGTVRVLMCCLAIIDGARAVGFDVGGEERELEWHLKELERRAPS